MRVPGLLRQIDRLRPGASRPSVAICIRARSSEAIRMYEGLVL